MDVERGVQPRSKKSSWGWQKGTLLLAYQSFGVVYGDLCISPVYVYKNTFSGKLRLHEEDEEILGVLSLVFWSLTLIPLLKYIILVLGADDNGEGGTFALYSLMCRRSRMGLLNSLHAGHGSVSTYNKDEPCKESRSSLIIRGFFEKHYSLRVVLLLFVLMGTSMVIGDGVLTPTMSVLSAVSGLRIKFPELHENYTVLVACVVLVGLFALQHYGTHRVGFLFAPILISWLACIGGIGIYNILKWNPSVVRALSPYYIYNFFRKAGKDGWSSLGGIVLCITGAEAMFADLGHFSKLSLRLGFTIVVYPCLVLAYMGEAAYLSKHREDLQSSFYKALPDRVFWPVLIIATLATAVGSQAIISATFSIISQCRALGCFPRIKVVHTSSHVHGQIYIPEVNWTLMSLCLAVTIGFRDTEMIGNAYGLAVIMVMFATTCLMFLVITTVWNRSVVWAALFAAGFGSVELLYLSACLAKVPHGGWLPLLLSLATLLVMSAWHYGTAKKQEYELQNKVCLDHLLGLIGSGSMGLVRVPGVGFVYSDAGAGATGVPPMFAHFVTNFPAFHRVLVFVSLQTLTVPKVPPEERFLVGRIGRPEYRLFRCVVRYGYKEGRWDHFNFENQLLVKVVEFLRLQADGADGDRSSSVSGEMSVIPAAPSQAVVDALASMSSCEIDYASNDKGYSKKVRFEEMPAAAAWRWEETRSEVRELLEEREAGVSYMVGHTCVFAHESSSPVKKFAVNVVYGFLRRNSRRPAVVLGIPHTSLIEVGMAYRV